MISTISTVYSCSFTGFSLGFFLYIISNLSSIVSMFEQEPSSLVLFTFLSYRAEVCRMELVSICFSISIKVFSNHSNQLAYFSISGLDSCIKGLNLNLSLSLFMKPKGSYHHLKLLLNLISCKHFYTSSPTSLLLQIKGPSCFFIIILNYVVFLADRKFTSSEFMIFLI